MNKRFIIFLYPGSSSAEYCQTDVFRPRCAEDEVIVVEEAVYGIPAAGGRCVEATHEHVGCQVCGS